MGNFNKNKHKSYSLMQLMQANRTGTLASIFSCTYGTHHALVPVLISTGIENLMVLTTLKALKQYLCTTRFSWDVPI